MERRFFGLAAFAFAWLVVLIVPETRSIFSEQAQGWGDFGKRSESTHSMPLAPLFWQVWPQPPTFQRLAPRYPQNIGVQLLAAEERASAEETGVILYSGITTKAYDDTIKKFPNRVWLLANRLRMMLGRQHFITRTAGELDARRETMPNGQVRWIARKPETRISTRTEIDAAIAVAQRGQRMEPDNYYFDAMLALVLFADNRDEDALRVLSSAKRKTRYDEHLIEDNEARLSAQELQQPQGFEEKIAQTFAVSLPHYEPLRQMARLVTWKGIVRARAGDHAGALQMYNDVTTLGARMRDGSTIFIGIQVADAIQQIVWQRDHIWTKEEEKLRRPSYSPNGPPESQLTATLSAHLFADYARAHGRDDLAQQTLRDNGTNRKLTAQFHESLAQQTFLAIPDRVLVKTSSLRWMTATLLAQLQWTLIACVVLTATLWLARLVRRDKENSVAPVRALDVAGTVAWIVCIIAVPIAVTGFNHQAPPFWAGAEDTMFPFMSAVIAGSPIVLGALYCSVATLWRGSKTKRVAREIVTQFVAAPKIVTPETSLWRRDVGKLTVKTINWILPSLTLYICASTFISRLDMKAMDQRTDFILPITFSLLTVFWWMVRVDTGVSLSKETVIYAVRWYRKSLSAMLVLSSIIYALLSLASLPSRNEATRLVNDYIYQGEVASLQVQRASTRNN